jgi:hypothetical protein
MRFEKGNISIREKIEILKESNVIKKFLLRTLKACLRRAAVGRCTPVGSRSLRSVRHPMENFLTEQKNGEQITLNADRAAGRLSPAAARGLHVPVDLIRMECVVRRIGNPPSRFTGMDTAEEIDGPRIKRSVRTRNEIGHFLTPVFEKEGSEEFLSLDTFLIISYDSWLSREKGRNSLKIFLCEK